MTLCDNKQCLKSKVKRTNAKQEQTIKKVEVGSGSMQE